METAEILAKKIMAAVNKTIATYSTYHF